MQNSFNLQDLVKHIVNGTFEHNICLVCLMPLEELFQYTYTRIYTENTSYCIADVLEQVCNIKNISSDEEYRICPTCFFTATEAFKFYHMSRRSQEIVDYYVNEINNQLNTSILEDSTSDSLCITLPIVLRNNKNFDVDINKIPFKSLQKERELKERIRAKKEESKPFNSGCDDLVMILNENGEPEFYMTQKDNTLVHVDSGNVCLKDYFNQKLDSNDKKFNKLLDSNVRELNSNGKKLNGLPDSDVKKKKCRKRNPMQYRQCSRCPVRYRFVRKLKEHMKETHGTDLFVCQVCQLLIEDEVEYNKHLQTHTDLHACSVCNMVFKKRETIVSHLKWHEEVGAMAQCDGAQVCEACGLVFLDEEDLKKHHDKKHVKQFTCYYCGRMYKGEISFELHIRKHEANNDVKRNQSNSSHSVPVKKRKRDFTCATCGRLFVDERALLWHERLHTNERPYTCDVCGRGFVSLNRRNQHAVCAHTAPARRCPLCPALFHLRSMINTHIKKVHLKAHKRPNRVSKHQNVHWKTEPVPIQELSVSIQNEILELQAAQTEAQRQIPGRNLQLRIVESTSDDVLVSERY